VVVEAFLYPLGVALLVCLSAFGLRASSGRSSGGLAMALAWCVGYVASYYALKNQLPYPPKEASHWHLYALGVALPIAALEGAAGPRRVAYWALALALFGAFTWFAVEPLRLHQWEGSQAVWMPVALAAAGALMLVLNVDFARRRPTGPFALGVFSLTLGATAFTLGQSSGGSAHILGGMSAVAGVAAAFALLRRDTALVYGAVLPFTLVSTGFLLIGVFFAATPWWSAGLLLAAPQCARLALRLKAGWQVVLVGVLCAAVPCAIAAYMAMPEPNAYGY